MCLWLLTACLGLLPTSPSPPIIIVPGVPPPILVPTTAATTTTTTATTTRPPPPGNMTMPPTAPGNMTSPPMPPPGNSSMMPPPGNSSMMTPPTMMPTSSPTSGPPVMTVPTSATMPPTLSSTTGPIPIDPRLGTTPGPSSALRLQPVDNEYDIQSYDMSVRFPKQKRAVQYMSIKDFVNTYPKTDNHHEIRKRQSCRCVPTGTCIRNGTNYGAGMIDIRIVTPGGSQCPAGQEYCCGSTSNPTPTPIVTPIACGTRQTVPTTGVTPSAGQANFGEYPWQAMILTLQNDYVAGGVLIDSLNIITVTHRVLTYVVSGTAPNLKVRLGEYDASGTYEPIAFQEYTIKRVTSHPSYDANTLQYDITVIRLAAAVPFTPTSGAAATINRACLPPTSTTIYSGQRCSVSGWGKDMFGLQGQYQQIIKKVEVPIVDPAVCQTQLRTARLGPAYVLDTMSFVCAGGEANKDACTGDGGSGLVCQVNGQWVVIGLVAWGLGCASANVPAVYVNIAGFLPWIQQQVATP